MSEIIEEIQLLQQVPYSFAVVKELSSLLSNLHNPCTLESLLTLSMKAEKSNKSFNLEPLSRNSTSSTKFLNEKIPTRIERGRLMRTNSSNIFL